MAIPNQRVDQFLRQNKDFIDTDIDGNPIDFETSEKDGVTTFSFVNDGERVTYEARPGRPVRPTLAFQGRQLKGGRRTAPPAKPGGDAKPGAERQRKPVASEEPFQPTQNGVTQPSETNQVEADDKPTYMEQYLRLARKLIEG